MAYQEKQFDQLQETLYHERMDNGLDVFVLPKKGFHKTFATFTTKYGSIDNHFVSIKGEELQVPDGIAHFLEHKMFEEEEGDIFHEFSKHGAQANAFTSFDRTAYLFSCTDNVEHNLRTLIDFVQRPYFTEQNVNKEKGIIEQEIRMYQDNPDWRVYFGFIGALYQHLPVKIDIAGTVDSIYKIDKETLYNCYETFYHPSNMLLFVVGHVDVQSIFDLVRDNQAQKEFAAPFDIQRMFDQEPDEVADRHKTVDLSVDTPKCLMGFKETNLGLQGEELLKQELSTEILMDLLAGPSTAFYEQLMEEGLIDESFGSDYMLEKQYGYSLIGGNSKHPEQLIEKVKNHVSQVRRDGLNEEEFERTRKKKIGSFLKALNSPEFIANQFTRYEFNGMNLFDIIPMLEKIRFQDVQKRLEDHPSPEQFAVCIVK
jgi:predicted Zn-dependent peptidase